MQQWVTAKEANDISDKALKRLIDYWLEITPMNQETKEKRRNDLEWWRKYPLCLSVYEQIEFLTNFVGDEDILVRKSDDYWTIKYRNHTVSGNNLCKILWSMVKEEIEK